MTLAEHDVPVAQEPRTDPSCARIAIRYAPPVDPTSWLAVAVKVIESPDATCVALDVNPAASPVETCVTESANPTIHGRRATCTCDEVRNGAVRVVGADVAVTNARYRCGPPVANDTPDIEHDVPDVHDTT